eukprot:GHVT01104879.1.p1 GENE.GHVT01104879.1~~GHVT01104879.1.p1  ORF type:complete len:632 (-),score=96.44 GHVT01104879.1:244-2139(-)
MMPKLLQSTLWHIDGPAGASIDIETAVWTAGVAIARLRCAWRTYRKFGVPMSSKAASIDHVLCPRPLPVKRTDLRTDSCSNPTVEETPRAKRPTEQLSIATASHKQRDELRQLGRCSNRQSLARDCAEEVDAVARILKRCVSSLSGRIDLVGSELLLLLLRPTIEALREVAASPKLVTQVAAAVCRRNPPPHEHWDVAPISSDTPPLTAPTPTNSAESRQIASILPHDDAPSSSLGDALESLATLGTLGLKRFGGIVSCLPVDAATVVAVDAARMHIALVSSFRNVRRQLGRRSVSARKDSLQPSSRGGTTEPGSEKRAEESSAVVSSQESSQRRNSSSTTTVEAALPRLAELVQVVPMWAVQPLLRLWCPGTYPPGPTHTGAAVVVGEADTEMANETAGQAPPSYRLPALISAPVALYLLLHVSAATRNRNGARNSCVRRHTVEFDDLLPGSLVGKPTLRDLCWVAAEHPSAVSVSPAMRSLEPIILRLTKAQQRDSCPPLRQERAGRRPRCTTTSRSTSCVTAVCSGGRKVEVTATAICRAVFLVQQPCSRAPLAPVVARAPERSASKAKYSGKGLPDSQDCFTSRLAENRLLLHPILSRVVLEADLLARVCTQLRWRSRTLLLPTSGR